MGPNDGQVQAWNGGESVHYVDHADRYDRQLAMFTDTLLQAVELDRDDTVLDVGCGCGVTTLRAAERAGRVVGLDISHPLVEIATARAHADAHAVGNTTFLVADAQTFDFEHGAFTTVISQFGLMFFDDPEAAFANLRAATAPGGRLSFICWQELAANEWLTVVARAVEAHVELPDFGGRAGGAGMFALKSPEETTTLLEGAGYRQVTVEPVSATIPLGGGGTLDESVGFLLGMGMVLGLLGRLDDGARARAIDEVRSTLAARYVPGHGVDLGAAGWLVSARC